MKKSLLIILGIVVLIILIVLGWFFVFNKECKNLSEDLKNQCELCSDSKEPVDCRDLIYNDFAILSKDLNICKNIEKDFIKRECLLKTEEAIISGDRGLGGSRSAPVLLEDGETYKTDL